MHVGLPVQFCNALRLFHPNRLLRSTENFCKFPYYSLNWLYWNGFSKRKRLHNILDVVPNFPHSIILVWLIWILLKRVMTKKQNLIAIKITIKASQTCNSKLKSIIFNRSHLSLKRLLYAQQRAKGENLECYRHFYSVLQWKSALSAFKYLECVLKCGRQFASGLKISEPYVGVIKAE